MQISNISYIYRYIVLLTPDVSEQIQEILSQECYWENLSAYCPPKFLSEVSTAEEKILWSVLL